MGDSIGDGRQQRRMGEEAIGAGVGSTGREQQSQASATQRMADDQLQQRQGGATSDNEARGRDEEPATLAGLGGTQRMADDTSGGRRQERRTTEGRDAGDRTQGSAARPTGERSNNTAYPTNGFWRDADWLGCRDGKFRPVEPGTFPLVNGAAARVGRLRGYGNAIVAQVAQTFIEATQGW